MPVVTIARPLATQAEVVAAAVAARLGHATYDDQLVALAAQRGHVPPDEMAALDERGRGFLVRPTDLWRLAPMPPIDPDVPDILHDAYAPTGPVRARGTGLDSPRYWAIEAYATLMARTIRAIAATEDAVIVGRAGHVVLGAGPAVLRVLCIAPDDARVARLAESDGIGDYEAMVRLRDSDRDRCAFHRQFFGAAWLDPSAYDLVVNTGSMTVAHAVDAIVAGAVNLAGRPGALVGATHD